MEPATFNVNMHSPHKFSTSRCIRPPTAPSLAPSMRRRFFGTTTWSEVIPTDKETKANYCILTKPNEVWCFLFLSEKGTLILKSFNSQVTTNKNQIVKQLAGICSPDRAISLFVRAKSWTLQLKFLRPTFWSYLLIDSRGAKKNQQIFGEVVALFQSFWAKSAKERTRSILEMLVGQQSIFLLLFELPAKMLRHCLSFTLQFGYNPSTASTNMLWALFELKLDTFSEMPLGESQTPPKKNTNKQKTTPYFCHWNT